MAWSGSLWLIVIVVICTSWVVKGMISLMVCGLDLAHPIKITLCCVEVIEILVGRILLQSFSWSWLLVRFHHRLDVIM